MHAKHLREWLRDHRAEEVEEAAEAEAEGETSVPGGRERETE